MSPEVVNVIGAVIVYGIAVVSIAAVVVLVVSVLASMWLDGQRRDLAVLAGILGVAAMWLVGTAMMEWRG